MIFDKLDLFGEGYLLHNSGTTRKKYESLFKKLFRPWIQVVMTLLAILYTISIVKPTNMLFLLFGIIMSAIFYLGMSCWLPLRRIQYTAWSIFG